MRGIHSAFIPAGLLLFATLAVVTPATATAVATSGVIVNAGNSSDPKAACARDESNLTAGSIGARCTGSVSVGSFDVLASASSDFGKMGVLASVDINREMTDTSDTRDILGSAEASANFQDSLTFSAGSEAVFTFGVHGGPLFTRSEFGKIGDTLEVVDAPGREIPLTYSNVTPGSPLNIGFAFMTDRGADVGSLCGHPEFFAGPCDVSLLSDWSDTATLESVQVLDDKGNPLSGVTITSESGFDYNSVGTLPPPAPESVPEPPTALLMALPALLRILRQSK